jgi:hypothetical protein
MRCCARSAHLFALLSARVDELSLLCVDLCAKIFDCSPTLDQPCSNDTIIDLGKKLSGLNRSPSFTRIVECWPET